MASVYGTNGQLARDVDELLRNQNDEWNEAAKAVSQTLETAEDLLLKAYSAGDDQAQLRDLATKLKITLPKDEKGNIKDINPEYVTNAAMRMYERAQRAWQSLQEIMRDGHRILMEQIRKLGA